MSEPKKEERRKVLLCHDIQEVRLTAEKINQGHQGAHVHVGVAASANAAQQLCGYLQTETIKVLTLNVNSNQDPYKTKHFGMI